MNRGGTLPQSTRFIGGNSNSRNIPHGTAAVLQQQQSLFPSIAQHNHRQHGTPTQQLSWALSKAETKEYNDIFRSWDPQNTSFIDGPTALSIFRNAGLRQDDLARIWTLADIDDRGKLNIAEFHVAMGLIYRRLNGMPIPDQLPAELAPPSSRDLNNSVDFRNRDRDYERLRSSAGRSPSPPVSAPVGSVRDTPPIPQHQKVAASSRPDVKKMTPAERQAFIKAEGQRLTQARMAALGVTSLSTPCPISDTSVEDRLQHEK